MLNSLCRCEAVFAKDKMRLVAVALVSKSIKGWEMQLDEVEDNIAVHGVEGVAEIDFANSLDIPGWVTAEKARDMCSYFAPIRDTKTKLMWRKKCSSCILHITQAGLGHQAPDGISDRNGPYATVLLAKRA